MGIVIDLVLVAIIIAICINSYVKGLVISIFNLVSSLAALILSYLFYPVFSGFLKNTAIFHWIQGPVQNSLLEAGKNISDVSVESLLEQLNLPTVISEGLSNTIGSVSGTLPELVETVSIAVAGFILDIICLVLLFIIVKIGLLFIKGLLEKITKLPLIHQVDKIGGLAIGIVEAFVLLTVTGAIFSLFSGNVDSNILGMVENTVVARFFYEQNLLIALLSNNI